MLGAEFVHIYLWHFILDTPFATIGPKRNELHPSEHQRRTGSEKNELYPIDHKNVGDLKFIRDTAYFHCDSMKYEFIRHRITMEYVVSRVKMPFGKNQANF